MSSTVKFTVRYWSSLLPSDYRDKDGQPIWVDYSVHPASKLGLHNALLAVHDRCEILKAHGGQYECALFVSNGESTEKLPMETVDTLFFALPHGEVKWLDIHACLLLPALAVTVTVDEPAPEQSSAPPEGQLALFPHTHTAYDDLDLTMHVIDIDI